MAYEFNIWAILEKIPEFIILFILYTKLKSLYNCSIRLDIILET